jgi:hypothetical protein
MAVAAKSVNATARARRINSVLWNTIYMQDALDHLQQSGLSILDDDVAKLSPLRNEHMNVLGHYSFTLADTILAGERRPLNQLATEIGDLESLLATLDTNHDV